MLRTLPDFAIVGAQKSASTLLVECLRQHPQVWMPRGEDDFFRDPVYGIRSLDDLSARYSRHATGRRLGIKSPDYLCRPEVPERLHRDLAAPQIIITLRDPVQRAVSAYFWRMKWGFFPVTPVEEGLTAILDGGFRDHDPTVGEILEWGRYAQPLTRYLDQFGADRVSITLDDDLRMDARAAIRRIFTFLGIDPDVDPPATRQRQLPGVYSLERLRFLGRRNRYVLHWNDDRSYATIPRPRRPWPFLFNAGVVLADRYLLAPRHDNSPPEISAELRARLCDYYAADIAAVEEILGRPLPRWGRGRTAREETAPASLS